MKQLAKAQVGPFKRTDPLLDSALVFEGNAKTSLEYCGWTKSISHHLETMVETIVLAPALACLLFPSRPSVETIYRPAEDTYKHAETIHKHAEATCKHADAIFAHVKATYTLETACKHASNVCNTT